MIRIVGLVELVNELLPLSWRSLPIESQNTEAKSEEKALDHIQSLNSSKNNKYNCVTGTFVYCETTTARSLFSLNESTMSQRTVSFPKNNTSYCAQVIYASHGGVLTRLCYPAFVWPIVLRKLAQDVQDIDGLALN